jgi:hypothetical protein
MTIQKFEVGKWYRWIGPKKRLDTWNWNPDGEMDFILDGEPHKCVAVSAPQEVQPWLAVDSHLVAAFENQPNPKGGDLWVWDWNGQEVYFKEVPSTFKKGKI